jgi:hypothetical protein
MSISPRVVLVVAIFFALCGDVRFAKPLAAQGTASPDVVRKRFDPFGGYAHLGEVPMEFREFDSFQIDLIEQPRKNRRLKVSGHLSVNKGVKILPFDAITLTPQKLTFTTKAEHGISYSFEGHFLRKGALSRFSSKVPVLEGRLSRYQNKRIVATRKMQFYYFESY